MQTKTVTFTRKKLDDLKTACVKAEQNKAETFVFDGNEFFVPYAKYLIQYHDGSLPK